MMTKALEEFVSAYRSPSAPVQVAGDVDCLDWVHTDEHGWNRCAVRKISSAARCPNHANHGRPVLAWKTVDQITDGDRVNFYHHASNQDQWATVLDWTPVRRYPDGRVACWDAVLHISDLSLGNGHTAGLRVQRHRFERHGSGIRWAGTPNVFR